jgi:hypothetical protein
MESDAEQAVASVSMRDMRVAASVRERLYVVVGSFAMGVA